MNVAWVVLVCYILCIKNLYAQPCLVLVSQIVFCNCFCSVNCIIIWELCMLDQVFLIKAYHTNISNHCICKVIQLLTLPEPLSWPSAIGPCPLSCSLYIVFTILTSCICEVRGPMIGAWMGQIFRSKEPCSLILEMSLSYVRNVSLNFFSYS